MNPQEIKIAIDTALKSVEDIADDKLKAKTYEIVLNNLLSKSKEKNEGEAKTSSTEPRIPSNKDMYEVLHKKFSVNRERIDECFEIKEDIIEILFPISLSSTVDEQFVFTIILLTMQKVLFDEREIESSKLRESASIKGIKSLVNLSTNLKKYSNYLVHKSGKIGSINTSYMLTIDGYNLGVNIIKQILNQGNIQEILNGISQNNSLQKPKRNSGLSEEVKKMIDEDFFSDFKSVKDAQTELKKREYHNRKQDIDSCIRQNYMKSQKLLLREKKDKVWMYIRKK